MLSADRYDHDTMLRLAGAFVAKEEYRNAQTVLLAAVAHHAQSAQARSALGAVLLELDDAIGARDAFLSALAIDPQQRRSWAGLGVAFERLGEIESADTAWREAFRYGGPAVSNYVGESTPVRVLLLQSAVDGNVPLRAVLDARIFQYATLFVESYDEQMELPPFDVAFNAVGNADLRTRALDKAERIASGLRARMLNRPESVRRTGRAEVAERLRVIPGVVTAQTVLFARDELLQSAELPWPLLVRSAGFHTGEHFEKVDAPHQLEAAVASLPGDELFAISYIDTRGSDGLFRKYRVLSIGGRLYPQHLAASTTWKVHQFSADRMADVQAEEMRFLENMADALGPSVVQRLERIAAALELDYCGIDFALDPAGSVVVFEANATMAIPLLPRDAEPCRRAAIGRAVDAAQMLLRGEG